MNPVFEPSANKRVGRYTRAFALWLAGLALVFGGFNAAVDPYAINGLVTIDGFNARKTRAHEDGFRLSASHEMASTQARAVVLGSSRTRDGFPDESSVIPGGAVNMGIGGSNGFELAQAAALAGSNPSIECVVIGVDLREFGTWSKASGSYWLSPLSDGSALTSHLRVALSPNAFARSLETVIDNVSGGADHRYETAYDLAGQRERFEESPIKRYRSYASMIYDERRVDYLFTAIDAVVRSGRQVRLFIHPTHAWYTEPQYRAGAAGLDARMRRDLVDRGQRQQSGAGADRCFPGPSFQIWDFGGYQGPSATRPPEGYAVLDPYFLEPEHYNDNTGETILSVMNGDPPPADISPPFGIVLNASTVNPAIAAIAERRERWLAEVAGPFILEELSRIEANPPGPEAYPSVFLNTDDWRALDRAIGRMRPVER